MGKEQLGIQTITLDKLDGGLNSNWLSSGIKDNEAKDCLGMIWMDGCLQPAPGFVRHSGFITGAATTEDINGIIDFRMRDGTQYLVVVNASSVWRYNTTTHLWVDVGGGYSISDNPYRAIIFNNRILATNGTDVPWVWTGTGNIQSLAAASGDTPPASAKYISTFNGRVVFLNYIDGTTDRPTRACFSLVDNQNSWDLTLDFWEVDGDDGDEITGGSQLGDDFVIFTNNTINLVTGYGTPWRVIRGFKKGVGCVSGDSLVHSWIKLNGSLTEVLTFMSHDGPKAFDGSNVYSLPLTQENEEYKCQEYFDNLNSATKGNICSAYYPKRNWLLFYGTSENDTTNDIGWYYVPENNALWPVNNLRAKCVSQVWNPDTNRKDVYIGTYDGLIYILSESDKSLEAVTELVTNGTMEANSNWTNYGTPSASGQTAAQAYYGTNSWYATTDAVDEGFYQDITTSLGQRYRVSAYVMCAASSDCLIVKSDAGETNVVEGTSVSATAWTRVQVTFTATAATSRISFRSDTDATSTFYVDEVSARCIEIDPYWESRYFDYGDEAVMKYLREIVPFFTTITGANAVITITYDKGAGAQDTDTLSLTAGSIDWTSLNWSSVDWLSLEETQDDLEGITQSSFRSHNIKIQADSALIDMQLNKIIFSVKEIGKRWYHSA